MKFHIYQKKSLILVLLFSLILASNCLYKSHNNKMQRCKNCNLIIISVDTLRADHTGIYGYTKNTTPNLDKWAKDAVVFTNMRTQVPATFPSFAMLLTGRSAFDLKIYNNFGSINGQRLEGGHPLDNSTVVLTEILKKSGYSTAAFIANPLLKASLTNLNKGFGEYYVNVASSGKSKSFNVIQQSLNWIDKNKNKKIFLWIHLLEPHVPYLPDKEYGCRFNSGSCDLTRRITDSEIQSEIEKLSGCKKIPEDKLKFYEGLYDAEIAMADKYIGQITNKLNSSGLDKNSLIVFYGDHGEGMDHNFYFSHSHELYDSHTKIPFIIQYPYSKGIKISAPLQNTQIFNTLLDTLGVNYLDEKKQSFEELLYGGLKSKIPEKYLYFVNTDLSKYSVQRSGYKYIYSLSGSCLFNNQREELYDLDKDPDETFNLIETEKVISRMFKKQLLSYLGTFGLPKPIIKSEMEPRNKSIMEFKSLGY